MKRIPILVLAVALSSLVASGMAVASTLEGTLTCANGAGPLAGFIIEAVSTSPDLEFAASATTDAAGHYSIDLRNTPACYTATLQLHAGDSAVDPASGSFDFCSDGGSEVVTRNFTIDSPSKCLVEEEEGACWLTAGGAKFSPVTLTEVGETTRRHNWGGNVYPSCSATPGDGGSWNHVDAALKLHFHGTHIEVVRCGNITDYPPGSSSPETPFNFIEFTGWGTLKGVMGNKADYGTVYFFARAEDRNEPGSNGQKDGAGKDRYFLNVYTTQGDPSTSVLLVDLDGNPNGEPDPVTITDGNMQIHITSCDSPPPIGLIRTVGSNSAESASESTTEATPSWGRLKVIYR